MSSIEIKFDKYIEIQEVRNELYQKQLEKIDEEIKANRQEANENIKSLRKETSDQIKEMRKEARDDRRTLGRYLLALATIFIGAVITIAIRVY